MRVVQQAEHGEDRVDLGTGIKVPAETGGDGDALVQQDAAEAAADRVGRAQQDRDIAAAKGAVALLGRDAAGCEQAADLGGDDAGLALDGAVVGVRAV